MKKQVQRGRKTSPAWTMRCPFYTKMMLHPLNCIGLSKLTKYNTLNNVAPKHWYRAFFSEEFKCDIIDDKLYEAFKGKIIEVKYK